MISIKEKRTAFITPSQLTLSDYYTDDRGKCRKFWRALILISEIGFVLTAGQKVFFFPGNDFILRITFMKDLF